MVGAGVRYTWRLCLCGILALLLAGCADLDILPSWVPFQGPASDELPGVTPPSQRMEEYRQLSDKAAQASPEERKRVSEQLAATIRTEQDPLVRLEIIRALGRYPGAAADAILTAAMSDSEARVRIAGCEAWGKRQDAQAVELLAEAFRSDVEADVRLAAAKALGETKNPAAVKILGEGLNDRDPAMQYRAMLALKQATGKDLGNNVERWQRYVQGEKDVSSPSWAERFVPWWR